MEEGATLTIEPDGVVKFAHERADDYYGITVQGTLVADGSSPRVSAQGLHPNCPTPDSDL